MKNNLVLIMSVFWLCFGIDSVLAQSNTLASGGEASGSEGSLSYSVGQLDYIYATGSGGSANQGVQQPFEFYVLGVDDHPEITLIAGIYPNPTKDNITLQLSEVSETGWYYLLYDMQGRQLLERKIHSMTTSIPMEHLPAAVYILQVRQTSGNLKTFKIIKH